MKRWNKPWEFRGSYSKLPETNSWHLNMCHPQMKLHLMANSELFFLITYLGSSKSDRILKIRVRFGYSWEHILYVPKVWSYSSLQHP